MSQFTQLTLTLLPAGSQTQNPPFRSYSLKRQVRQEEEDHDGLEGERDVDNKG